MSAFPVPHRGPTDDTFVHSQMMYLWQGHYDASILHALISYGGSQNTACSTDTGAVKIMYTIGEIRTLPALIILGKLGHCMHY